MERRRIPKFSFPMPGRKSKSRVDRETDGYNSGGLSASPSMSSIVSAPQWPIRYDETSNYSSKAHRILGTAGPPYRHPTHNGSGPTTPSMVSDVESDAASKLSVQAAGDPGAAQKPKTSHRPSSRLLPDSNAYAADSRQTSVTSGATRRLLPRSSDSAMHSHYNAQSTPLAISQQTSNSAVRDMALRKGKPRIGTYHKEDQRPSTVDDESLDRPAHDRKSKPGHLDIAKLFPQPLVDGQVPLLSPAKMVHSPAPMSSTSEVFPRPMTREPTPTLNGQAKLKLRYSNSPYATVPQPSTGSLVPRRHPPDRTDNAKIHIRRPPPGIKHWFEGFEEDSDETADDDDDSRVVHAPRPIKPSPHPLAPTRKSSLGRLNDGRSSVSSTSQLRPVRYMDDRLRVTSGQVSPSTIRIRDSTFSKSNLQDASILSFSSSDEETDGMRRRHIVVRDSIDMSDFHENIVIGQAQALSVRSQGSRRPSTGKISLMSNSTNAATIEVMYSPDPPSLPYFARNPSTSRSRRSSRKRQPSIIQEDDVAQALPQSSAPFEGRSPTATTETQKYMAVTPEEEALLEALRKKRAAMAQQSFVEGFETAVKLEEVRQITPPLSAASVRTSGFLSADSITSSPVRIVDMRHFGDRSIATAASSRIASPPRGRAPAKHGLTAVAVPLRDAAQLQDNSSSRRKSAISVQSHRQSLPPDSSPLTPFPPSISAASPTPTELTSPLPSPITPGLRHSAADVKVASSEQSSTHEIDNPSDVTAAVAGFETGVIDPPAGSIKSDETHATQLSRHRTASSDADATAPSSSKSFTSTTGSAREMVDSAIDPSSRRSSAALDWTHQHQHQQPQPNPYRASYRVSKASKRSSSTPLVSPITTAFNTLTSAGAGGGGGRTASPVIRSAGTGTGTDVDASSPHASLHERSSNSRMSHTSSSTATTAVPLGAKRASAMKVNARNSVSEDVLAAWGNLGGLRDYGLVRH